MLTPERHHGAPGLNRRLGQHPNLLLRIGLKAKLLEHFGHILEALPNSRKDALDPRLSGALQQVLH